MHTIIDRRDLSQNVIRIEVDAPLVARRRKPGQFVIVRAHEQAERIPLTIVDSDPIAGTITLIYQVMGEGTRTLSALDMGDVFQDIAGPLGRPTHLEYYGKTVCIGGGIGVAPMYPIVRGLKEHANEVIVIMGTRNSGLLILEDEMRDVADEVIITTDDGSAGFHGFVSDALSERLEGGYKPDLAVAIGPLPMMRGVAEVTRPYGIHTIVSLNPIMVDGTGMCGGCRVTVGGERKFACVDGPEFDGHKVDYAELASRQRTYLPQEEYRIR